MNPYFLEFSRAMRIINCNSCRHIYYIHNNKTDALKEMPIHVRGNKIDSSPPCHLIICRWVRRSRNTSALVNVQSAQKDRRNINRWSGEDRHVIRQEKENINLSIENRRLTNVPPIFCQLQKPRFTMKSWVVVVKVFSFCTAVDPIVCLIASQC